MKRTINLTVDYNSCTGCMACAQICPKHAINFNQDVLGNIYPSVCQESCINCGLCMQHCPNQQTLQSITPQHAYACWSLNNVTRKRSASGGVAAEFYHTALKNKYWICGAQFNSDGSVTHTLSRDNSDIRKYQQSKYVFSDSSKIYSQIKDLLDRGEKVIIISLPCKIAGLLSFLKKTYLTLLTVDIVCHGTPPMQMLKDHINNLSKNKTFNVKFRDDNQFVLSIDSNGQNIYKKVGNEDEYLIAFLNGLNYRNSCYQCKYANPKRISDITICDFWGLGADIPFDHPYTGSISAVLTNTINGSIFFDQCRASLFVEERPVREAINGNAQLNSPTTTHPKRNEFISLYVANGFTSAVSKLYKREIKNARRQNRINALKQLIKSFVKKILKSITR